LTVLQRDFYSRETQLVARELLGTRLVREDGRSRMSGMILETEAYLGTDDSASHAHRGPTPRNAVMFGPGGFAYVYLVYGMHYMLNLVTETEGCPGAVLIRALLPLEGESRMIARRKIQGKGLTNGPAKLCGAMDIDKSFYGWDLTQGRRLWVEPQHVVAPEDIWSGPRVGIAYASAADREASLRFWINSEKARLGARRRAPI
jgi:DNA-3-methyladenine glycosylase